MIGPDSFNAVAKPSVAEIEYQQRGAGIMAGLLSVAAGGALLINQYGVAAMLGGTAVSALLLRSALRDMAAPQEKLIP